MNTNNVTTGQPVHWIVWFKTLNFYDKATVKQRIIKQCLIKDEQTFKNWIYSYIPVPPLEQNVITKIAKQPLDFTFEPRPRSYHYLKTLNQ